MDEPLTPQACPPHLKPNQVVMSGWLKFLIVVLAIGGFILAMEWVH